MRERLDLVLVRRGLAETRERAQALILSGAVRVDGVAATRPAQSVAAEANVALAATGPDYVSRGALKLLKALEAWPIDPRGRIALDVGASTGGFTDLLLRRGAARVYAVDVGYGQLHYRLRTDPRVVSMERTNIRYLSELPERPDLAVIDVSFISLRLALPPVFSLVGGDVVALIKPQFEAGRQQVKRGGVVRDPAVHRQVVQGLADWSAHESYSLADVVRSPISGPAGNVEFLSRWQRGARPASREAIQQAVASAGDNASQATPAC